MYSKIAKGRISDVIRIDTITNSQADFMATHVPVKNIDVKQVWNVNDKKSGTIECIDEQTALEKYVKNPTNKHQFLLVIGASGSGKSHLIRWFQAKYSQQKPDNEVVMFIKRADNTLRGTIKQLLDIPEVANIPNKELFDKLTKATAVIEEKKLKDMIYHNFIVEINNDDSDELSRVERKRLISLLQNDSFQDRLLQDGFAIDRIFQKISQSNNGDTRDVEALFDKYDFILDADFAQEIELKGADRKAVSMAANLADSDEDYAIDISRYMNSHVNSVIQSCAGVEPGDFEQIFLEIRRELFRQGKSLSILIEDITAFTGINVALLNVLTADHSAYKDKDPICRISSIIGITSSYYENHFPDNYEDRVTNYMCISDDAFGADLQSLYEFSGRYLNAMSLPETTVEEWLENGAYDEQYPVHETEAGKEWDYVELTNGKKLSLFPFSKRAIHNLFQTLPEGARTPRYFLRDIIERGARNYLFNGNSFPSFEIANEHTFVWKDNGDIALHQHVDNENYARVNRFIRIWGSAEFKISPDKKTLGGIPLSVYLELGMPDLSSGNVDIASEGNEPPEIVPVPKPVEKMDPRKISYERGKQHIREWMQGKSLVFDSTKADAKMIPEARDEMNRFVYNAINWQIEGVSTDNLDKYLNGLLTKKFVGFKQTGDNKNTAIINLDRTPENEIVLQAFVAFVTLGDKKRWNFEDGEWLLYHVHCWFEKIRPVIIEAVNKFENHAVDYQECAVASEILRNILFGYTSEEKISKISSSALWADNIPKTIPETNHSNAWKSLMKSLHENASDTKNVIFDYYNIVQGAGGKNKFVQYSRFDKATKEILKNKLKVETALSGIPDDVALRKRFREQYKNAYSKIDSVANAEIKHVTDILNSINKYIEIEYIVESDVLDLSEALVGFYNKAEETHIHLKFEVEKIKALAKEASIICAAIETMKEGIEKNNALDVLMVFSSDPVSKVVEFIQILDKADADISKTIQDVNSRKNKVINNGEVKINRTVEKNALANAKLTMEGWNVNA